MQINYDYSQDTFTVDDKVYLLGELRKHLTSNHEQLVQGHFIKAIKAGNRTKFTFDWQTIYFKAEQYSIIKNYIDGLQRTDRSPR